MSETAGQVARSGRRDRDLDCQFEQLCPRRRRHERLEEVGPVESILIPFSLTFGICRLRNRQPGPFANLSLFHRAMRLISTNHFQAPVRRFVLDLFEVSLDQGTLVQLRSMDIEAYAHANLPGREVRDSRRTRNREDRGGAGAGTSTGSEGEREYRRRSASSPGPEPPGRSIRTRGLTISEMGHLDAAR